MKLIDYMRREGIADEAMAGRLGDCSAGAVKKWKYGERTPDADRIIQIQDATHGAVGLQDWATQPERAAS